MIGALAFPKAVPERDAKYLAFVRTHPCALCVGSDSGSRSEVGIEAAHSWNRDQG